MKQLVICAAVAMSACFAFADHAASESWVAQQITNALNAAISHSDANAQVQAAALDTERQARANAVDSINDNVQNVQSNALQAVDTEKRARQTSFETIQANIDTAVDASFDGYIQRTASWVYSGNLIPYKVNPIEVTLDNDAVITPTGTWPDSKPTYVYVKPNGNYSLAPALRLVGYGSLPTSNFQGVIWGCKGQWFLNVIIAE